MSGEDGVALAEILETAGQRAEEIRSEIANLKEKTGNNAVTVPQLLKGDAVPDVTEPAEAGRADEPDGSLQFTVSTPSGERQAPPKTEDGTDTEDLDRKLADFDSPIQIYVRSSQSAGQAGEVPWTVPGLAAEAAAAATAVQGNSDASRHPDAAGGPGSWQDLYQNMIGKLSTSQSHRKSGDSNSVAEMLISAGMASAVDTTPCNSRAHQMATPFAVDTSQLAAVAAGAITTQQSAQDASALQIEPSPVHVIEGRYQHDDSDDAAAAAGAQDSAAAACLQDSITDAHVVHTAEAATPGNAGNASSAGGCDSWTHSPSWLVTPEPKSCASSVVHAHAFDPSSGGGDSKCALYDPGAISRSIVVPASAADLPVQAVLQELDELLQWNSRTPTHQQQHLESPGKRLFAHDSRLAKDAGAEPIRAEAGSDDIQPQGEAASPFAVAAEDDDLVLKWLQGQKSHLSRGNSTSCLLSDEFVMRAEGSASASSSNSRPRRSSSVPLPSESRRPSVGGAEEVLGSKVDKAQQQKLTAGDLQDELLDHLRLAAAFCAHPRASNTSSMQPVGDSAEHTGAASTTAAAGECAVRGAPSGVADNAVAHGVSLVGWVGAKMPEAPAIAAAVAHESEGSMSAAKPMVSSFSITSNTAENSAGGSSPLSSTQRAPAASDEATPSPKFKSKSAQLYQQLLGNVVAGGSARCPGGGNRSRQGSRAGALQASRTPERGSYSAGEDAGIKLAAAGCDRWSSPAGSPVHQSSNVQKAAEHASTAAASVTCTACGSPVLCGPSASKLQQSHMSIADLAADKAADTKATAAVGDAGGDRYSAVGGNKVGEEPIATTHASLAALLISNLTEQPACSSCKAKADGHSPMGPESSAAQQKLSRTVSSPRATSYAASAKKPTGYAGLSKQNSYAATAAAAVRSSGTGTRPGGHASGGGRLSGDGKQSISRQRAAGGQCGSMPGGDISAAAADVPHTAMVTAISCGQLLAAAALEQAMGRVSAGGVTGKAGSMADAAAAHVELLQQREMPGDASTAQGGTAGVGQAPSGTQQQQKPCQASCLSLSDLTEQEREQQEQALEEEIAQLKRSSSTGKAASSVFVYRLHPTNEPDSSNSAAAGSSSATAAAAAAAMQTLAACANRKAPRAASLSPVRMHSANSNASRESKHSSSSDPPQRRGTASQAVSRSSSAKSTATVGNSSNSSARVWRPGGSTSAKDESRKLKAFESARNRILGPATDTGASNSSQRSSQPATSHTSAFGRCNSSLKKPAGQRVAAAVAAIQGDLGGTAALASLSKARSAGKAAVTGKTAKLAAATAAAAASASKSPAKERRVASTASPAQAKSQARVAARTAAAATSRSAAAQASKGRLAAVTARARKVQEQAVQADMARELLIAASLPALPGVFDASRLLGELKGRTQRAARQSTPGRMQTAGRLNALNLPVQQVHDAQLQQASPTTYQVEEAIKAAQVALLQRRWQISQLRKAMEQQHGIGSVGSRSHRSSIASHMVAGSGNYGMPLVRSSSLGQAAAPMQAEVQRHISEQQAGQHAMPAAAIAATGSNCKAAAVAAMQRSSSAGDATARTLGPDISSPGPLRPSSAQAVVMKAVAHVQASQQTTASCFATQEQQHAAPVALGVGLGSRRASCSAAPRRRSSIGNPVMPGSFAAGGAAPPPWSAPRRVSSAGLTGEELMAYYRRSSAAETAEALQAVAVDTGDVPAPIGLQLDAMVRAYNLLSKRKSVDKTAALAALMAQIVAVANGQMQPEHMGAACHRVAEPTAGLDARQLLETSTFETDGLAEDGTKLDILGRSMNPDPAEIPAVAVCGANHVHVDDVDGNVMSPTHCMLQHAACKLGEFAGGNCNYSHDSFGCIRADALAAADGNGVVVVHMRTTDAPGRLPLRETATGKAVLAGIDSASLTVHQAVHWLKVGLTRLDQGSEGAAAPAVLPAQDLNRQQLSTRVASPARAATPGSPSRAGRSRSRPCSPFKACFASAADLSDGDDELQQQQPCKQEGVHFEMDCSNQLVMCVPVHLTGQDACEVYAAGVPKYTVTGVALPADSSSKQGGSSGNCLELVTCAGRHRIELASARDWAGLLAGLNAMLLLREQVDAVAAEKLGAMLIADTTWSAAVQGVIF